MTRARDLADSADKDIAGTLTIDGLQIDETAAAGTGILLTNDNNTSGTYSDIKWQYASSDPSYGSGIRFKQVDTTHGGQLEFFTDSSTGTYTQRMTITEDGNVGIGTSSPSSTFRTSIYGDGSSIIGGVEFRNAASGGSTFTIGHASATSPSATLNVTDAANLTFKTNNTERMRISSTGKVGINNTSPVEDLHIKGTNPRINVEGDGSSYYPSIRVTGNYGGISLGTYYGGNISGENGIVFLTGSSATDGGTERMRIEGNSIKVATDEFIPTGSGKDLGSPTYQWRDLYLSGGVYLGGTGSANKLDDYEEGTWTPSVGGATTDPTVTYTSQAGFYVKIGRMVHISMYLNCTSVSGGSGAAKITGIPFNINNAGSYFAASQMEIFGLNVPSNMNNAVLRINGNSGHFRLEFINTQAGSTGGTGVGVGTGSLANNFRVLGSFTYMTS